MISRERTPIVTRTAKIKAMGTFIAPIVFMGKGLYTNFLDSSRMYVWPDPIS